jgi:DNA-directed RNA polymerase specialized sigma24 family protein
MDNTGPLIRQLSSHLATRSCGEEGNAAMDRFRAAGIDVRTALSPIEVAEGCHGTGEMERSRSIVSGLLGLAHDDEVAALTALVALSPGLYNLANRLVASGWDRAEAESAVVGRAYEEMVAPDHATSASEVVFRARAQLRNEDRRMRRGRADPAGAELARGLVPSPPSVDAEAPGADPAERVETVLFDAVGSGVLTADQALAVGATRGHDIAVDEVATLLGLSSAAVRQMRRRAEARLAASIAGSLADQEVG